MKAPVAHDGYANVAKRLLRWALLVVAVAGLLAVFPYGFTVFLGEGHQKADRVRLDVDNLHRALRAYRTRNGSWPPEDSWGDVLVAAELLLKAPVDPWDHPYEYRLEAVDGGEAQPVVTSAGKDGVAGTEDDLPRPDFSGRR